MYAAIKMVQREPNLTLTLEALGSSGALLSTESKVSFYQQRLAVRKFLLCKPRSASAL